MVTNLYDAAGEPRLASRDPAGALWEPFGVVTKLYDAPGEPRLTSRDPAGVSWE